MIFPVKDVPTSNETSNCSKQKKQVITLCVIFKIIQDDKKYTRKKLQTKRTGYFQSVEVTINQTDPLDFPFNTV